MASWTAVRRYRGRASMVASIGKIASPAQGVTYYERDGYYAKDDPEHKAASAWAGKGAGALGPRGPVDPNTFKAVLEGKVPEGPHLGKRDRDGNIHHRPGRDVTLSAPKSVSLVGLIGGDDRVVRGSRSDRGEDGMGFGGLRASGRRRGDEFGQPDQVVGGGGRGEHPAHPVEPAMPGLGQPAGGLDPAEALLDALAQPLARGVTRMPGGAPVDPGLAPLAGLAHAAVDGDVGGDVAIAQRLDELGHVVGLVGAERNPPSVGMRSS